MIKYEHIIRMNGDQIPKVWNMKLKGKCPRESEIKMETTG
jgi:hypothetical protein